MDFVFYLSALVAVVSTVMVITSANAVRALLYLIVSLLAVALVFFVLGAPLAAALEGIVYAGAIVVLFLLVVMLLNLGGKAAAQELGWLSPRAWIGPGILTAVLTGELVYALLRIGAGERDGVPVGPAQVGRTLFGAYVLGIELASMLLLAGLVRAYHLGRRVQGSGLPNDAVWKSRIPNPEP